jgi:hypothetical protein
MTLSVDIKKDPRIEIKARRTLDGNILIFDHEDIDILLSPDSSKCMTFPKEQMSDKVYQAQDRMFRYLARKGIVEHSSIRGGNVYGSLEAKLLESKTPGIDSLQACLYMLSEYLSTEKPFFRSAEEFNDDRLDHLLHPGDQDSTELGDVPQSDKKGSHGQTRGPYGFMYNYSLVRENKQQEEECS